MMILSVTALSCLVLVELYFKRPCARALKRVRLERRLQRALSAPALSLPLRAVLYLLLSLNVVSIVALVCGEVLLSLGVLCVTGMVYVLVQALKLHILGEPLVWSDLLLIREMCLKPSFYFAYVPLKVYLLGSLACAALPVLLLSLTSLNAVDVSTGKAAFLGLLLLEETGASLRLQALLTLCFALGALAIVLNYVVRRESAVVRLSRVQDDDAGAKPAVDGLRNDEYLAGSVFRGLTYHATLDGLRLGVTLSLLLQLGELLFLRREYHALLESLNPEESSLDGAAAVRPVRNAAGKVKSATGSVLLVQAESAVNLAELVQSLGESRELEDAFSPYLALTSDMASKATLRGRLGIDYTGAYTMRSEFAVLTGLDRYALGIYAYDPYQAVRSYKVRSLAYAYRAQGYRTLCIHPNAATFFNREKVMQNLGFDSFISLEKLPALKRHGPHVADLALLDYARELIESAGEKLFLFVITMEAHGPWLKGRFKDAPALSPLGAYARHVVSLYAGLKSVASAGITTLSYGDHLPPLPETRSLRNLPLPEILGFNLPAECVSQIRARNAAGAAGADEVPVVSTRELHALARSLSAARETAATPSQGTGSATGGAHA
ncbi:MAG TPA: sulfatase-like hydrolase/transferase [Candidatus Avisuccinivibrio pullicola]|nr:sulfatase-like hydrolase/transferase [Candidatus Avisuccinivibrio pullicola]